MDTGVFNKKIPYEYLSKDAQNEIIYIIASKIKTIIAKEWSDKPLSVIIDETLITDILNHQQVSVVLRYLNDFDVKEIVGFIKTSHWY